MKDTNIKKMHQYQQFTIKFNHLHQAVRKAYLYTREHSIKKPIISIIQLNTAKTVYS
jgi:hypothetical protein